MSTKAQDGNGRDVYVHEDEKILYHHFGLHQKVEEKTGSRKITDKRVHKDYCDICYPTNKTVSDVFNYFLTWATENGLDIRWHTGKSVDYYIAAYRLLAAKTVNQRDAQQLVRKLLRSLVYRSARSLHSDLSKVYKFIKDSSSSIASDTAEQPAASSASHTKEPEIPANWEDFGELNLEELKAKEKKAGKQKQKYEEDTETLTIDNSDNDPDQSSSEEDNPIDKPDVTYNFSTIHALEKEKNNLVALLTAINNAVEPTPQEMNDLVKALQDILGEKGENLRSEKGILDVEPFAGKSTEDPISWLGKFERARIANRWNKSRLVDIAGGLMKGEAAAWFEATKDDWDREEDSPRYDEEDRDNNGQSTFTTSFKERFVTDQRKNEWHVQLLQLKQNTDTVEEYTSKFLKLVKHVGITDDVQMRRMYLFGLNPAYITFVQMGNHANLNAMITAAKQVETGFSLSTGKVTSTTTKKKTEDKDLDILTSQIQQLSLNYAMLANAFVTRSEPARPRYNNNNNSNRGNSNQRRSNQRNQSNSACYSCGKTGHFAKDCYLKRNNNNNNRRNNTSNSNWRGRGQRSRPQTRFVLPTNSTRSLHHFGTYEDTQEGYEEYDYEDDYDYEVDAYIATRATTREGKAEYTPTYKHSESRKEQELQIQKLPQKIRKKMQPAPIEDTTAFEVARYLSILPSGLSVGQAAHLIPSYRQGIAIAGKRTRASYYNTYSEEEEEEEDYNQRPTTAMQCELLVGKEPVKVIIDSGAATSIITHRLMKKLGYKITAPSRIIVVTTNGDKVKPLGVIKDFPISINYLKAPTTFEVLESPEDLLLLGNDWLLRMRANLDWGYLKFAVNYKGRREVVNTTCYAEKFTSIRKVIPDDRREIDGDEIMSTYYTSLSESESDEKNDEVFNPAIFLAQMETEGQNEDWNLKKHLHVGPLDQHQHDAFQKVLAENNDVCAKNQMDIGRTAILKHTINTGHAEPQRKTFYQEKPSEKEVHYARNPRYA